MGKLVRNAFIYLFKNVMSKQYNSYENREF